MVVAVIVVVVIILWTPAVGGYPVLKAVIVTVIAVTVLVVRAVTQT